MRPIANAAVRLFIVLLIGALAAPKTLAQASQVSQAPPKVEFEAWREIGESPSGKTFEIAFPSAFQSQYAENNTVFVKVKIPSQAFGPIPCVLLLHYLGAANFRVEDRLADLLNERGIAAAILTLPYHMKRTPIGFSSGELAVVPDVGKLRETMTQSIWDVRRTLDFLDSRSEFVHGKFGIMGTSLGSIVASLAFAIDPRLISGGFCLAGVDIAHILWNSSRVVAEREGLRKEGYTEERLRSELTEIEPLTYLKPDQAKRSLVIRAVHDSVIPFADSEKLLKALHEPQHIELDTGHFGGVLVESQILRHVASFFSATLQNRSYRAPLSLYSPTIRLGILANGATGLQVAAGLDLWRSNRRGDGFASVVLTPRGLQGFLGYRITQGLAIGFSVTRKRTTWGAIWSIVL